MAFLICPRYESLRQPGAQDLFADTLHKPGDCWLYWVLLRFAKKGLCTINTCNTVKPRQFIWPPSKVIMVVIRA